MTIEHPPPDGADAGDGFTIHIDGFGRLIDRATHTTHPTDLIIAPIVSHRRNLNRRLARAGEPADAFSVLDPTALADTLLEQSPATLGRVARLRVLQDLLETTPAIGDTVRPVLGGGGVTQPERVERCRALIESLTNFHPDRLAAYREAAATLPEPQAADARALLEGGLAVEQGLRTATARAPSPEATLRRATRRLRRSEGAAWTAAHPHPTRVALIGLSRIAAPLIDLLTAIRDHAPVAVELFCRPASGPVVRERLAGFTVARPGREACQ